MDLFNQTRKEILQAISKKKDSASGIAKQVQLSLPYTLSQLAILEASGYVKKEKSKKKAYGKPRLVYSIKKSFMELNVITKDVGGSFSFNGTQPLTETYLQIIAALPQNSVSAFSEYYWKHSEHQHKIEAIGLLSASSQLIELLLITEKEHLEDLRKQVSHFESSITGKSVKIACWVHTLEEITSGIDKQDEYYLKLNNKVTAVVDKEDLFLSLKEESKKVGEKT